LLETGVGPSVGSSHHKITHTVRTHVIAYRAMLDVPRELVVHLSRLLAAHRRGLGTRKQTRALTCWRQAAFALVWFRDRGVDLRVLGAGFGISRATAYRYRDEALLVLTGLART
jgi:hypothetical protein